MLNGITKTAREYGYAILFLYLARKDEALQAMTTNYKPRWWNYHFNDDLKKRMLSNCYYRFVVVNNRIEDVKVGCIARL